MGLTISYGIDTPKAWNWKRSEEAVLKAREFAATLPGVEWVHEISHEVSGYKRQLYSPWRPGCHDQEQEADRSCFFIMLPGLGSETADFGLFHFPKVIIPPQPLKRTDYAGRLNTPLYQPYWHSVLTGTNPDKTSLSLIKGILKKWKLVRLPGRPGVGQYCHGVSWAKMEGVYTCGGIMQVKGGLIKGPYTSHRHGYGEDRAVLLFDDMERIQSMWFRHTGPVDKWLDVCKSAEFKEDMRKLMEGDPYPNPESSHYSSFCKTIYAADFTDGGYGHANFMRSHLAVCAVLEHLKVAGFIIDVGDESGFFENRDIEALAKQAHGYHEDARSLMGVQLTNKLPGLRSTECLVLAMNFFTKDCPYSTKSSTKPEPRQPISRPSRDLD